MHVIQQRLRRNAKLCSARGRQEEQLESDEGIQKANKKFNKRN